MEIENKKKVTKNITLTFTEDEFKTLQKFFGSISGHQDRLDLTPYSLINDEESGEERVLIRSIGTMIWDHEV